MKNYIIRLVLSAIVLLIAEYFIESVTINGFVYALLLAVLLSALNTFVKPILKIFALPLNLMTLGLFSFIINAVIILIADYVMDGNFETGGFLPALGFSIIIGLLNSITNLFVKD